MNRRHPTPIHLAALPCAAALLLAPTSHAQTTDDLVIDQFGDDFGVFDWSTAWGLAPFFEWDENENSTEHPGNPAGAMKVTIDFDILFYGGEDNQSAFQRNFPDGEVDFADYTHIHFDVKVDENSSRLTTEWGTGQFGSIDPVVRNAAWDPQFNNITTEDPWLGVDDYGVWRHFALPVDQTIPNHNGMTTLMLHIWSGWEPGGQGGPVTFWLDNVYLEKDTSTAPPPPPTLTLAPATSGLQILASQNGSQWQRQGMHTTGDNFTWVGAPGPVSYEIDVKSAPGKNGFQSHIFLVPNATPGSVSPDWGDPDVVMIWFTDNGDGTSTGSFGYKVDEPNGNSQIYGANLLATLPSTSAEGTWAVTFENDTDVTMTAPDGATVEFAMNADDVTRFADPLTVYFGAQPNELEYIGSGFVFQNLRVTGVPDPIDDSFATPGLDPAVWTMAAEDPNGVVVAGEDAQLWLTWTLPANGFVPEISDTLATGSWSALDSSTSFQNGANQTLLLTAANLPGGGDSDAFVRMIQRPFEKLQVLLPGESPAPGMPGGKTGTPTPQQAGVPFDVIVNSVDADDNFASIGRDVVYLTTDPDNFPDIQPVQAALLRGTQTFSVTIFDAGTYTVTATDFDDPVIPDATSSSLTVNP